MFDWFVEILRKHPEIVFFLVLGIGYALGKLSIGSFKLGAVTGTLLAWYGWDQLLTGTLAGSLFAGVYGASLIVRHAATRRSPIPFGPFMFAGALLVVLLAA